MKSFLIKNFPLLLIIFIAAFLRFNQLGIIPPALTWDEASNGYNAYSLLKTGKDEYGNFLPLTIRSFGDYNPALSAYLLIPSIAIFGLTEFGVRFPSAFLGTITIISTYFLTLKIAKNKNISLTASFLLAISPWHLQFSRYDHEANFMISFGLLGLTLFLYSAKNYLLLIISLVSFGLALNTYQGAKIWIPLFIAAIFYWYRIEILKYGRKLLTPALIFLLFTIPIILNFERTFIRGQSVGILEKNNSVETFISGYLSHFSPNFLFISGDNIGRHAVSGLGQLYIFELPLIILGFLTMFKKRTRETNFILTWLLIAAIPAALATPSPHALRAISFLPTWAIIAAFGVKSLATWSSRFKFPIVIVLTLVGVYNIITYFHIYYNHYPKLNAYDWQDGHKEMVQYVQQVKDNYNSIAITSFYGRPYIFVLFYSKYDPAKYHSQSEDKNAFDKFEFFGPSWEKTKEGKALVITPPWQAHPKDILQEIFSENGDLTFTISQTE